MNLYILAVISSVLLWSNLSFASALLKAPQQFANFAECPLRSGQVIAPCRIGYRTYGTLNDEKSNAVLVPTWFTGTSAEHAYLASPELLNPEKYFIIIVDALANGVSTSPSNSESQGGGQFPQINISDMVDSQYRLLTETLNIQSLHSIVGLSMGGMQAFEWSVRFPSFAKKTVAAIGSPRLAAFDIALWSTNNRLLALYRKCECKEVLEVMAGIGMLAAVPSKLAEDISREDTISVITTRGQSNTMNVAESWDRQRQAEAMIEHNIARDFDNDWQKTAAQIKTEFLIIIADDDRVVTPQPARQFATLIGASVLELDEDCGHGAPWCAPEVFAQAVSSFINK
jgi:homoserine O-acetyltransferase/O-succinyltransferase